MDYYLVGGAVRDELLGLTPKEHDYVVVGATPQMMLDMGYTPVGKDFPVFLHPQSKEEYALARTERKSGPGYTGFTCYAAPDVTLEDDLKRRDLTINAIARDASGKLTDPYGGLKDLEQRILRHVSPAFSEDPLRILRIARFAARFKRFGFKIAEDTRELMQTMVAQGELSELTAERVWQEISRSLLGPAPAVFFQVLDGVGAWPDLFGLPQIKVDLSVMQRLHSASAESPLSSIPLSNIEQRFAALCIACSVPLEEPAKESTQETTSLKTDYIARHLSQHWKTPKACRELASLVSLWWQECVASAPLDSGLLCKLLQRSDPMRRSERWQQTLAVLDFLSQAQVSNVQVNNVNARLNQLKHAAEAYISIDIKSLLDKNLHGPELATAIQTERELAVSNSLAETSSPADSAAQSN